MKILMKAIVFSTMIFLSVSVVSAQKRTAQKTSAKPKPIVFAVLDDGKTLEPIAEIDNGKLAETANGDEKALASFTNAYYKPKTVYNLIFGGAANGTVTVNNFDAKAECGKNLAQISTASDKAKLKGYVMALATSEINLPSASGVRRLPSTAERTEIESLVRAEFIKQKVSATAAKTLKYYNLTAIDVDNDDSAEMVGSYWVQSSAKQRNELFFIAEKDKNGKYKFGYSDYAKITPDQIMSGEMKDLDTLGGELLLDTLDVNNDKIAEIFTIDKAFEGNNFHVYRQISGKWTRIFEGYNYHCAF
jgi:hypothetical protein